MISLTNYSFPAGGLYSEVDMYIVNGKGSIIRLIAGLFIMASVILGMMVSEYFLYFTALVGFMLFLSATVGFCPMELIMRALGLKEKVAVDK